MVGFFFSSTAHFRSIVIAVGRHPARREARTILQQAGELRWPSIDHAADVPPSSRGQKKVTAA